LVDVKFRVRRLEQENEPNNVLHGEERNEMIKSEHRERAQVIHAVAAGLDMEVKEWSEIDTQKFIDMREEIPFDISVNIGEIVMGGVFAFKIWLDRKKIQDVTIKDETGRYVSIKGIATNKLNSIIDKLGLSKSKTKTQTVRRRPVSRKTIVKKKKR
jgi:hypothetical protein